MEKLQHFHELIDNSFQRFKFEGKPNNLYDPLNYIMGLGGKRMRPVLTLIGCELFHGDPGKALYPAMGVEVFHNFTLMHDDIMDQAPLRRGQQAVHQKWNEPTAILSGDLMLVKAYELIMRVDGIQLPKVLEVFNQTATGVCEGQQMDMDFESRDDVSVDEYIQMISLKTAVLLGCSLKIGALIAKADEEYAELLYDYGVNMGVGFQLMDDILDVFGDAEKVGKQHAGDILSDKKTYLLLKTLELVEKEDEAELKSFIGNTSSDPVQKINAVKGLYEKYNVRELTQELSDQYFNKANRLLEAIPVEEERKLSLRQYTETIKKRIY